MAGPEAGREDADASQANPFENAKKGDKFYAVLGAQEGRVMRVWDMVTEVRTLYIQSEDSDGNEVLHSIPGKVLGGDLLSAIDLQLKQGDTLEILEGASYKRGFSNLMIVTRYRKKDSSSSQCDYLMIEVKGLGLPGGVEWKKDQRGEDNLMGPERAEQLISNFGPTRSTDAVSDGVRLGALAQRIKTMLG